MNTREIFISALSRLGLRIKNERTFLRFEAYCSALIEKNRVMNLTAVDSPDEIYVRHFADSLAVAAAIRGRGMPKSLIDVGCGAGFPGLPLKIFYDDEREGELSLTLLDSTAKKISFLEELCALTELKNVCFVAARAEEAAHTKQNREGYDLAVSRAVANLSLLSELCLPFVRPGGLFCPHKSARAADELAGAGRALGVLGAELSGEFSYTLGENQPELLVLRAEKKGHTPPQYPRAFARIKSKPL